MTRESVLASIVSALDCADLPARQTRQALQRRLQQPQTGLRPDVGGDIEAEFLRRLEAVQTSYTKVDNPTLVAAAVAEWRDTIGLSGQLVVAPALQPLGFGDTDQVIFGRAESHHECSVSGCLAGVAETGGLALAATADSPATLAFLPENHIVVVYREQLVRHIEDVWPLLRARNAPLPRSINFNTGPSRTADIEQTLEIGAHGPRRMHVILVG